MSNEPTSAEDFLADYIRISTRRGLLEVLKDLRYIVDLGLLRQISGTAQLHELSEDHLVDVLILVFESVPGGTKWRLGCDTYHGSACVFRKLEVSDET